MRPLLPGDLDMGVRVLLAVPEPGRPRLAAQLLREAETAHAHADALGIWHPHYGSGSLRSAAQAHTLAPLPPWCDRHYRAALAVLLAACAATDLP